MGTDIWIVIRWWGALFLVGSIAYPFTKQLFRDWSDHGYLFAKAVGMALVTYLVYLAGMFRIFPFTQATVFGAMGLVFLGGLWLEARNNRKGTARKAESVSRIFFHIPLLIAEELFFFGMLLLWSWVKGHEPSIHGLEKFMDYGFTQSILNSRYFPAPDMWFAGLSINYYYFGHTVMAMLTKLSDMSLGYTYNLMLATIFAFTATMSFGIGYQICRLGRTGRICAGVLTAFLVTMAGNMQTIYAFTKGYMGENPPPFWTLLWKFSELGRIGEGLDRYWYANATRFIPFSIHEFPSYSFVVSDVHGHVLSIPFVLLAIALLVTFVIRSTKKEGREDHGYELLVFYGLLVSILLMTNALDGPIYFGLLVLVVIVLRIGPRMPWKEKFLKIGIPLLLTGGIAGLASIPFMLHFKSFVTGVAVNCPVSPFADMKIGPILFEGVEKCQHSPLWMMALLWGFFIYCGLWLLARIYKLNKKIIHIELLLVVFFIFSLLLIIFPEFFYFKDIYPAHFRSNTMFKLGYQAFILLSIVSAYTIIHMLREKRNTIVKGMFVLFLVPQLFLVCIFPYFSIRSYFDNLRTYKGLYGLTWLMEEYPDDYAGIVWLKTNASMRQGVNASPVIIEADGDSYTDASRFSTFTGFPTIVGWAVHEWLWRGSYDAVAPRREEVRLVYESDDPDRTRDILTKYAVRYIIVGKPERQKYLSLREDKIAGLGELVFTQGQTKIYKVE